MKTSIFTVEQAAQHLKLHPKTVLRYIRDGRLPATRVGKSYRIARSKLEAFAGEAIASTDLASGAQATCIVAIDGLSSDDAQRLAAFLQSAAMAAPAELPALQLQTAFDPLASSMKVIVIGSPASTARMLEMLDIQLRRRG